MKRKLLKSLLAIACLLSSTSVSAYDFEVDGIYYDVVSFSELTCKIVKENDQSFYEGDFVIPATVNYNNKTLTVVEIAGGIFNNCSELTSITIPNTISSIGDRMFSGCSKLEHVTIEDGETVLELGIMDWNYNASRYYGLFSYCPITSVYIGRNLSYKRYYGPFSYVETLKEVIIGDSVTEIGDYMFEESGLKNVTIGNSVTTIGYCSFYECSNLTGLIIPNSVTTIESSAFFGCSGLTSLTIPNSVTTINTSAFKNCI